MTDAQTTFAKCKRLRRQIAAAEQNADIQEFVRRTFDGIGTEVTA